MNPEEVVVDFVGPYRDRVASSGSPATKEANPATMQKSGDAMSAPPVEKQRIRLDLNGNVIK